MRKHPEITWEKAPDIQSEIKHLIKKLDFSFIESDQIYCFRSNYSSSRARARIWSMPRIWQLALNIKPCYIIEVLSEKFDNLKADDKTRVLIHELMHIPKSFSGSLVPHRGRFHRIDSRTVELLFRQYLKNDK